MKCHIAMPTKYTHNLQYIQQILHFLHTDHEAIQTPHVLWQLKSHFSWKSSVLSNNNNNNNNNNNKRPHSFNYLSMYCKFNSFLFAQSIRYINQKWSIFAEVNCNCLNIKYNMNIIMGTYRISNYPWLSRGCWRWIFSTGLRRIVIYMI